MRYNWQQKKWPKFSYDTTELEPFLYDFTRLAGHVSGLMEGLTSEEQTEALISIMVVEGVKTSEIEGEYLSRNDVMSSIKRNLGLDVSLPETKDQRARGIAQLMLEVRNTFNDPLAENTLFKWHSMLMQGASGVEIGQWRVHGEPMQIISGAMGREIVHFEAPPSFRVPEEMQQFLTWFNTSQEKFSQPIIRAAIAHLHFESIHPFEDGNGRIGRAIAEKALSQDLGRPVLFSLSRSIEDNKKAYYDALQKAQRSNEITEWITYFVHTVLDAQTEAERELLFTLKKTRFFDKYKSQLNERQQKVVKRMLEAGTAGFEGGMNARKYIGLTGVSKATATRDLQDLVQKGVFKTIGGGRSSRYGFKDL